MASHWVVYWIVYWLYIVYKTSILTSILIVYRIINILISILIVYWLYLSSFSHTHSFGSSIVINIPNSPPTMYSKIFHNPMCSFLYEDTSLTPDKWKNVLYSIYPAIYHIIYFYLYIHSFFHSSMHPSGSIRPSFYLMYIFHSYSIHPFIHSSIHLSFHLPYIHLLIHPFIHAIYLSTTQFIK